MISWPCARFGADAGCRASRTVLGARRHGEVRRHPGVPAARGGPRIALLLRDQGALHTPGSRDARMTDGRQVDIWAAGVTLYVMATGVMPFGGVRFLPRRPASEHRREGGRLPLGVRDDCGAARAGDHGRAVRKHLHGRIRDTARPPGLWPSVKPSPPNHKGPTPTEVWQSYRGVGGRRRGGLTYGAIADRRWPSAHSSSCALPESVVPPE